MDSVRSLGYMDRPLAARDMLSRLLLAGSLPAQKGRIPGLGPTVLEAERKEKVRGVQLQSHVPKTQQLGWSSPARNALKSGGRGQATSRGAMALLMLPRTCKSSFATMSTAHMFSFAVQERT